MSISVSRFGRQFGLSRSALLYYDRIGLLSPSVRSADRAGSGDRIATNETRRDRKSFIARDSTSVADSLRSFATTGEFA